VKNSKIQLNIFLFSSKSQSSEYLWVKKLQLIAFYIQNIHPPKLYPS